jgi:hypothetical protein
MELLGYMVRAWNSLQETLGKPTKTIYRDRYGLPPLEVDPHWEEMTNCHRSLEADFNQSLEADFMRAGYIASSFCSVLNIVSDGGN